MSVLKSMCVFVILLMVLTIKEGHAQANRDYKVNLELGANYYNIPLGDKFYTGIMPSMGVQYIDDLNTSFAYSVGVRYSPRFGWHSSSFINAQSHYADFNFSVMWYPAMNINLLAGIQRNFQFHQVFRDSLNSQISKPKSHFEALVGLGVQLNQYANLGFRYSIPFNHRGFQNLQLMLVYNFGGLKQRSNLHRNLEEAFQNPLLVEKIVLHRQRLTELPSDIHRFENMRELFLDGNALTQLPDEIGGLKQLRKLSARFNAISELPETIEQLKMLEELHLDYNQLEELPAQIGQLENLRFLYLSNNDLSKIPPEIGMLSRLVVLDVSQNKALLELPAEIGKLSMLEKLYVSPETFDAFFKPSEMNMSDRLYFSRETQELYYKQGEKNMSKKQSVRPGSQFAIPFVPPNARFEIIVVDPENPDLKLLRR